MTTILKRDTDENYARLAIAIVEQACKDATMFPRDVKKFFCSEDSIFQFCMPHTDGPALLKQVYKNFKEYGNYCPPLEKKDKDEIMDNLEDDVEEEEKIKWLRLLA